MNAVWLDNRKYYASGPRKNDGLYPYTCDAFTKAEGILRPVRSQVKLYYLALILKGIDITNKISIDPKK